MTHADPAPRFRTVEHIRDRPGVYVGGRDFFAFVHYLVAAVDLLLDHGASWIEVEGGMSSKLSGTSGRLPNRPIKQGFSFRRCGRRKAIDVTQ